MSAAAELLADGGAAAAADEFFRSPQFLAAEGVTHTLRIEGDGGELLAPLRVREIEGADARDAISPYGYPGLVPPVRSSPRYAGTNAAALDPGTIDFSATGLVSVFLRHRLGPPPLAGARERTVVHLHDPAQPRKSRASDRRQVRRNEEAGYTLTLTPGPKTSTAERAEFLDVYEQTMHRTGAAPHYFFPAAYFDRVLGYERTWLAIARTGEGEGEVAAASLAAVSDGHLHYYLSGSADIHLADSPMKNVVARLVDLADELALPLNLGGGIVPGDPLDAFKRGFANAHLPWHTSEIICDREKYAELTASHTSSPGSGPPFFPAYRA